MIMHRLRTTAPRPINNNDVALRADKSASSARKRAARGDRNKEVSVGTVAIRSAAIAAWVAWAAAAALAQGTLRAAASAVDSYPNRPVLIVVPFTPGTGMDILARQVGQKLGERWKQSVVVENRPGASGNIGTELVAKAPADGYTLLMSVNTLVMNASLSQSS